MKKVRGSAFAIVGMIKRAGAPGASTVRKLVSAICVPQVTYGMPVFMPDSKLCASLDLLMAMPLRQALRLPKTTPAAAILTEYGLLTSEHLFAKEALAFARRAATQDSQHPTAELWASETRCQERSEAKRCEALMGATAVELTNEEASQLLQRKQLSEWWGDEERKYPLPVTLVKMGPGPARYLAVDPKEIASRRARLRFDRSGLRESLRRRRLTASGDCPDCKGVTDTPEHVLIICPVFDAARRTCEAELRRIGCELNLQSGLGGVEELGPQRQISSLRATAGLLAAIERIGARRNKEH
jgi:hypothetical protein